MRNKKCENCSKRGTGSFNGHEFCSRPSCIEAVIKRSCDALKKKIKITVEKVK